MKKKLLRKQLMGALLLCSSGILIHAQDQNIPQLSKMDSIYQKYVNEGYPAQFAEKRAQAIASQQDVQLRTEISGRPATPNENSIKVGRANTSLTPTQFVTDVLLKAGSDKSRIRNVQFSGWNWDQTAQQWQNQAVSATDAMNGNVVFTAEDRSLLYFERGNLVDPSIFELEKGLLLATGPALNAEGPNQSVGYYRWDVATSSWNNVNSSSLSYGARRDGTKAWAYGPAGGYAATANDVHQGPTFNDTFDGDLDSLIAAFPGNWTTEGSILEFDFQPYIEKATFDYIFASEEYPEWVYQGYNDVFGFFVTGPYDKPKSEGGVENAASGQYQYPNNPKNNNIAILNIDPATQDTTYVGVDYTNWGRPVSIPMTGGAAITPANLPDPNVSPQPSSYYLGGRMPTNPETHRVVYQDDDLMEYDGYSITLQAVADRLVPNQWYHLKLAVAQVGGPDIWHGSACFLNNLDLGTPNADIEHPYLLTAFDYLGEEFLYDGCVQTLILSFDSATASSMPMVEIEYIGIGGDSFLDAEGNKLFPNDTVQLTGATDTIRYYPFQAVLPKDIENGVQIGIVANIGGARDTAMLYNLYNKVTIGEKKYYKTTANYAGKIVLELSGGSPQLHRKLNDGEWKLASIPFTKSEIANAGEQAVILLREPNTCYLIDTIILSKATGEPVITRPIYMPEIPGAICSVPAGENFVDSRDDFVFTITPTGSNVGLELVVTTSRTSVPDSEGLIIEKLADGSYKITIRQVQEPINVYVDFVTSNASVQNHKIWTNNDQLYIQSDQNETANIYTVSGELFKSINLNSGETTITSLPRGFYIVKMAAKTHKIVIK
ncbi:MAG: T9SS type A sorting domain-containing protein [Tannerella sp.]|jgi:hypothetical protein|nr:T9SS type A sorting domain-containing protein [Tannerella sp.]